MVFRGGGPVLDRQYQGLAEHALCCRGSGLGTEQALCSGVGDRYWIDSTRGWLNVHCVQGVEKGPAEQALCSEVGAGAGASAPVARGMSSVTSMSEAAERMLVYWVWLCCTVVTGKMYDVIAGSVAEM